MEIIKSLKRKENKRGSLSKLKIDLTKSPLKNVEKIIKYISKDLNNIDLGNTDPSEYMIFNNFKIDIGRVFQSDVVSRVTKKFSKDPVKLYEYNIYDDEGNMVEIYSIPEITLSDSNRKYYYRIPSPKDKKKILDTKYVYGLLKCLDIVFDEVLKNNSFYLSEDFKHISVSKSKYTSEVMGNIIDIFYNTKASMFCLNRKDIELYTQTLLLIIDVITIAKNTDLNVELSEKYEKNTNSECARAFETKKNIPNKIVSVMNNNRFLKDFTYVELDEETEIYKFRQLENEWIKVKEALKIEKFLKNIKPELRFKKLGKHKALGLYYPSIKCICIDITSPSSFIHEFGHFIDYTNKKGQLSLKMDFYPIILGYKAAYNKFISENPNSPDANYLRRKSEYYFAPTEIFARGLEIYLVNKGMESSFVPSKDDLSVKGGYPEISNDFLKKINEYYDEIMKVNLKVLQDTHIQKSKKKSKYVKPIMSTTGQLCFNIG